MIAKNKEEEKKPKMIFQAKGIAHSCVYLLCHQRCYSIWLVYIDVCLVFHIDRTWERKKSADCLICCIYVMFYTQKDSKVLLFIIQQQITILHKLLNISKNKNKE